MNKEYIGYIFDNLPKEQRDEIFSKIKVNIPGFRRPDLAPSSMLKNMLKNDEKFAKVFLNAVEKTQKNFLGEFAQKCKTLDSSQESCEILEKMVQAHEKMSTSNIQIGAESVGTSPVVSENLGQGDSKVVDTKIEPNIGSADQEEDYMSETTQYIGYVQETNFYYNFWPIYVVHNGTIEQFDTSMETFPNLGNVNLFGTSRDYIREKCSHGDILVITISSSDLIENRKQDGDFQKTHYKVDFKQLEGQGKIKRLEDIRMYPVLHPKDPIDFTKKTVLVKEEFIHREDPCLIEESDILYGPYKTRVDENDQTLVNINPPDSPNNGIVNSYHSKNGKIDYTKIDIDIPDFPHVTTYNVCLNDSFKKEEVDKITDQDLFRLFQNSLSKRKDSGKLSIPPALVDDCAVSEFQGLPDKIIEERVQKIKKLLGEQFRQEEVQEDVAKFIADLLYKFGESDFFSNLLERILDNSNLAQKIQSFSIIQRRLEDMQNQYEETKRQCAHEREQLDKDREAQISRLTDETSDEIRNLNVQKEKLQKEIDDLWKQNNQLKQIEDLSKEKDFLERRNRELEKDKRELEEENRELEKSSEKLAEKLKTKLSDITENTLNVAYDGKIADQVIQAAAKWKQTTQDDDFKRIAAVLTNPNENPPIFGDELAEYLIKSVQRYRPEYSRNDILNIFICVTQNFLTVFSGEPGTGKTSISNIVAHVLGTSKIKEHVPKENGIELSRYVPISIERGWTSKRDFIGYYNPLSQVFEQANKHLYDGLRLLDTEGEQSMYPYIVLLDEANLSPIEYYWADFMNICDNDSCFSEITLGNDMQLKIPPTLRFIATINNDDTTERLSPRLIDRAALIRLPDVPYKKIEDENLADTSFVNIVEWAALQKTFAPDSSLDLDVMPNAIYEDICKLFRENIKLSISPRVDRAIRRYWVAAKDLFESEGGTDKTIIALDYTIAQKLLPKINGNGKTYSEFLSKFQELCEKNNLKKSGTMLTDIIKRGEASMNYYQYF